MRKTVLAVGEVLWDLLPTAPKLGGAPFSFAYRIDSLGDRGLLVSRIGRDELGDRAREQIDALGMDARFIQRDDAWPTGKVGTTNLEASLYLPESGVVRRLTRRSSYAPMSVHSVATLTFFAAGSIRVKPLSSTRIPSSSIFTKSSRNDR
jgi:hypothetical protein